MVGAQVKMSPIIVGRQRKIVKLHWLNALKQTQTNKFKPENKLLKTSFLDLIY